MKKFILYIVLHICCLWFSSCDDYLEVKTYGQVLPETTEEYASLIYTHLNKIEKGSLEEIVGNHSNILKLEFYSDNLNASLCTSTPYGTLMYAGENVNSSIYRFNNLYKVMKDMNIVLDNLKDRESEEGKRTIAIAYTMRAVLYYNLMRDCCEPYDKARANEIMGMPIVDHFDMEATPGRGSIENTVNFIINDLQDAITLNQTDETYLFTADVAKAYLAKTYFWAQKWKEAAQTAKELLDKYPLIEGEAYKNMIQTEKEKLGNVILRSFITGSLSSYNTQMKNAKTRPIDMDLIQLFTEKDRDIRYSFFFDNKFLSTKGIHFYIRSAEMCLIVAESYAHLSDNDNAFLYLNQLRSKRIKNHIPLTMNTLPAVNKDALVKVDATGRELTPLMAAILNERRKELFMEGDRWYELKRNGRPEFWVGYNGIKYVTKKYLYTYPLMKYDLKANPNLVQNEGYDKL